MRVEDGRLTKLTNKSGHYKPSVDQLVNVLDELESRSIDLNIPLKVVTPDAETDKPSAGVWLTAQRGQRAQAAGPAAASEERPERAADVAPQPAAPAGAP